MEKYYDPKQWLVPSNTPLDRQIRHLFPLILTLNLEFYVLAQIEGELKSRKSSKFESTKTEQVKPYPMNKHSE